MKGKFSYLSREQYTEFSSNILWIKYYYYFYFRDEESETENPVNKAEEGKSLNEWFSLRSEIGDQAEAKEEASGKHVSSALTGGGWRQRRYRAVCWERESHRGWEGKAGSDGTETPMESNGIETNWVKTSLVKK